MISQMQLLVVAVTCLSVAASALQPAETPPVGAYSALHRSICRDALPPSTACRLCG